MEAISLEDKFKNELIETYPDFEIVELIVHEKEKTVIIEAKAKTNFVSPIGKVLHLNFEKRLISSWLNFTDFQFYRQLNISGEDVVSKGPKIPSKDTIMGIKGKGLSK